MISDFSPIWFFGYDVAFEIIFMIVSFLVALFAFKIYKKTSQQRIQLFGISFLLISISYLIQSILNFLIITKANEQICTAIKLQSISVFNYTGIVAHIFFMIIGYAILVYTTFRTDKIKIMWLMIIISLLTVFFSQNTLVIFYLLSSVYLVFICFHYIYNYLRNKQTKTLLVATAFLFLLFSVVHFIISVNHQLFYVIGHLLELSAYLMILTNLYLIFRK